MTRELALERARIIASEAAPRVRDRMHYNADNSYAAAFRKQEADEIGARVVAAQVARMAPRKLRRVGT